MKKFKGRRKLDELIQIAESKGFEIDMQKFDKEGSDFIWLRDMDGRMLQILYNTTNGHFYVYDPLSGNDPRATHLSEEFDGEEWYDELLEMFYEPLAN